MGSPRSAGAAFVPATLTRERRREPLGELVALAARTSIARAALAQRFTKLGHGTARLCHPTVHQRVGAAESGRGSAGELDHDEETRVTDVTHGAGPMLDGTRLRSSLPSLHRSVVACWAALGQVFTLLFRV
jgi:hypothetical protein